MRVLVTGASGFLGSKLANHFASQGHQVHAVVREASNLDRLNQDLMVNCQRLDLTSPSSIVKSIKPDFIVHTACSYGRHDETPMDIFAANTYFGMQLLDAAQALDKPCVFINTGTVLDSSVSFYALTKNQFSALGEQIALLGKSQLKFIDVALQHMYGPGDSPSKFTTHVIQSCMKNTTSINLSAGTQRRDFIYIDDVINAYSTLVENADQLLHFERVELGSGTAPTVREFVEQVKVLSNSSTKLLFGEVPFRTGEQMLCVANTTRMNQLGWQAKFSLKQGLDATIKQENF
jgi:CDP-paratose synthetase